MSRERKTNQKRPIDLEDGWVEAAPERDGVYIFNGVSSQEKVSSSELNERIRLLITKYADREDAEELLAIFQL
jgi:hypothetical protein